MTDPTPRGPTPDESDEPGAPLRSGDVGEGAARLVERLRGGASPPMPPRRPAPAPNRHETAGSMVERMRGGGEEPQEPEEDDPGGRAAEVVGRVRERVVEAAETKSARRSFWKELPFLILIALVVAVVIKTFLVQAFFIESGSMRSTLLEGDRVMVNKLSYAFDDLERGDIVVFDPPGPRPEDNESFVQAVFRNIGEAIGITQPSSEFIKRIIAVEGETVEVRNNQVLIDGQPIAEPYLAEGAAMADFGPQEVPENHVFVMGDNRNQSRDSRFFGAIPEEDVIGRAFVRVWPPSRWGGL